LRLVRPSTVSGAQAAADTDQLVECVYISPTCPAWFGEVVENFLTAYGKSIPLQKSTMAPTSVRYAARPDGESQDSPA
jgi:hypothetical protein